MCIRTRCEGECTRNKVVRVIAWEQGVRVSAWEQGVRVCAWEQGVRVSAQGTRHEDELI